MASVRRSAKVPYSAAEMFKLVNDVETYPEFLHWCRGARSSKVGPDTVEATLDVGVGGVHKSFTTLNSLSVPNRIEVSLVSGPFRRLSGEWRFEDQESGGCLVSLELDFSVTPSPFSLIFAGIFEEIARSQMDAFLRRAKELYGR